MYSPNRSFDNSSACSSLALASVFIAVIALFAIAPMVEADSGSVIGSFADLEPGGRGAGLAGALAPVVDDPSALYWNPARLTEVRQGGMTATYADQFGLDLVHHTSVFVAFPLYSQRPTWSEGEVRDETDKPFMTWGIGFQSTSVDLDPESYSENDIALGFGRQSRFGLSYGLVTHFLMIGSDLKYENDDEVKASGYSLDLAINKPVHSTVSLSVVMKALVSSLSWDQASGEDLIPRAICGLNWEPRADVRIPVDLTYDMENSRIQQYAAGIEWLPVSGLLTLRCGARWRDDGTETDLYPGAGFSLRLKPIVFDYGLATGRDELGDTHRFGLRFTFN